VNAQDAKKPVVHVFLQLDVKSSVVEKSLQEKLPDLAITVFGRFRDFEDGLANGRPDALLTGLPALTLKGKKPVLQGQRNGKTTETYVLAVVNQSLDGPFSGKTIGVVDLLGREGSQAFVSRLLKTSDVKVKRVAKIEDLLPLLEFSAADGVVLPTIMLPRLLERTQLPVKSRELTDEPVGLCAVAVDNPATRDIVIKAFQRLDSMTKRLLSIDSWSVP